MTRSKSLPPEGCGKDPVPAAGGQPRALRMGRGVFSHDHRGEGNISLFTRGLRGSLAGFNQRRQDRNKRMGSLEMFHKR